MFYNTVIDLWPFFPLSPAPLHPRTYTPIQGHRPTKTSPHPPLELAKKDGYNAYFQDLFASPRRSRISPHLKWEGLFAKLGDFPRRHTNAVLIREENRPLSRPLCPLCRRGLHQSLPLLPSPPRPQQVQSLRQDPARDHSHHPHAPRRLRPHSPILLMDPPLPPSAEGDRLVRVRGLHPRGVRFHQARAGRGLYVARPALREPAVRSGPLGGLQGCVGARSRRRSRFFLCMFCCTRSTCGFSRLSRSLSS